MEKSSLLDNPPNDSTAGMGWLDAMLQTDLSAVDTLGGNKSATTGNVASSSSSSRANGMFAAPLCKKFREARSIYLRGSAPEVQPPPRHRPPGDAVVSVLTYRCVRVDGRL